MLSLSVLSLRSSWPLACLSFNASGSLASAGVACGGRKSATVRHTRPMTCLQPAVSGMTMSDAQMTKSSAAEHACTRLAADQCVRSLCTQKIHRNDAALTDRPNQTTPTTERHLTYTQQTRTRALTTHNTGSSSTQEGRTTQEAGGRLLRATRPRAGLATYCRRKGGRRTGAGAK
ncbi:uncharacterized protein C8Q71DRAFT_503347 [Rhodofomes roseus]|uniref:Secreted protein n=1 Tax=Rhodofomes roseus TaxID=34475 RepID=A0ABQ8KLL9_9APHY|nr:uncharacterized protein C8Q71DRAFT_503347 [Rhodofomes roseus]KAH9839222.1 hypothetical protein C8Q71DRAFT_503347 [Rhodofomes roseus]